MTKANLKMKLKKLNNQEFEDIFNYFENKKWVYKLPYSFDVIDQRIKNFVDCYPNITYTDYLKKIDKITVLILGLGTGGSYLIDILSKLGISKFIIIDGDTVERKNLRAQNYVLEDIGKYKGQVLKYNYENNFPKMNIDFINKRINSYDELESYVDLNKVSYFINCADDFELQISIVDSLFKKYPDIQMFYGGYSFLIHSDTLITKYNYKELMNTALKQKKSIERSNYISENAGSIFNGYLSAYIISKLIFNSVILNKNYNTVVGNLYDDEYLFR